LVIYCEQTKLLIPETAVIKVITCKAFLRNVTQNNLLVDSYPV